MKKTFQNKSILAWVLILTGLFLFQSPLMAEGMILNHTGTLEVTDPAGVVSVINPADPLPGIVSGSKVEVSSGIVEIAPSEGFIQLLVGGSVATVKAGDKLKVSFDPATSKADFAVDMGSILIVTGNTTTTLKANQQALIALDKAAGIATVESLAGDIETVTVGVKSVVLQGATGQMSADAKTRNVHIENTPNS